MQTLSNQQPANNQRKRATFSPKRNWVQRNPRLFQITFITSSLLLFFSRPLYDAFIADPLPPKEFRVPPHRR